MNVFFKTNTLSLIFVHLSVLRWHFFTPFRTLKNSIFATFPFVLSACPAWKNFELFRPNNRISSSQNVPKQFPHIFPVFNSSRGFFAGRHTHSFSLRTFSSFCPFRGWLRESHFQERNRLFSPWISAVLERNPAHSSRKAEGYQGEVRGVGWVLFSPQQSPRQGKLQRMD